MVVMSTDGTLAPDTLEIDITSPRRHEDLPQRGTAKVPSEAQLPDEYRRRFRTVIPTASVSIDVSVWAAGMPLDVRQDRVLQVPTDRVAELDIVFSANCAPQVESRQRRRGVASARTQETCDLKSGSCVSNVVTETRHSRRSHRSRGSSARRLAHDRRWRRDGPEE